MSVDKAHVVKILEASVSVTLMWLLARIIRLEALIGDSHGCRLSARS